jgi:hypothetical protein
VFDPLSTIIKLAILSNKNDGCKISIKDNMIYIQNSGVVQCVSRYYYGDSKTDLHFLSIPIELACNRYLLSKEMLQKYPKIVKIFECAKNGLTKLMQTYKSFPIIIHCLKYYYSIIETSLLSDHKTVELIKNIKVSSLVQSQPQPTVLQQPPPPPPPPPRVQAPTVTIPSLIISSMNETKEKESKEVKETKEIKEKESKESDLSSSKIKTKKRDKEKKEESNNLFEESTNKDIDVEGDNLMKYYTDTLLNKLDGIWDNSKINIVIELIEYLLTSDKPTEYASCLETLMEPIDKNSIEIISANI